jgi:hypothetical protein
VTIDAGDEAVRLSGEALHFAVVRVGGAVVTVFITADDADVEAFDRLVPVVAAALS